MAGFASYTAVTWHTGHQKSGSLGYSLPRCPHRSRHKHLSIKDIILRASSLHEADAHVTILFSSVQSHPPPFISSSSRELAYASQSPLRRLLTHSKQHLTVFISSAFARKAQCRGPALVPLKGFAGEGAEREGEMLNILCLAPSAFLIFWLHRDPRSISPAPSFHTYRTLFACHFCFAIINH